MKFWRTMLIHRSRSRLTQLFGALVMAQASTTPAQLPGSNLTPARLTFGLSSRSLSDVTRNDAQAAFKTFTDAAARKRGYNLAFTARVFEDVATYQTAIREHQILTAVIDAWDYVSADLAGHMEISFVKERGGEVGEQYLLLTRRGSAFNTLADLRGKELNLLESANAKLSRRWLNFLVLTNELGDPARYFSKIEASTKPSPVTLPVFFGKRPACVVTRAAFDVMRQLNPQLGRDLQTIATSPLLVETLLCTAPTGWESEAFRQAFFDGMLAMSEEPAGQQILNLFRADRFVRFRPEQMATLTQLHADYERLSRNAVLPGARSAAD